MKTINKLSVIFCMALLILFANAALAKDIVPDDITILHRLGIINGYEDGELHGELNITRMEFAAIVVRSVGLGEMNFMSDGISGFADVPSDSWGASYVRTAKEFGFVSGYSNGNFGPDDNITITDAAKILVSVLGYDIHAEEMGGYPTGYLHTAANLKILDGIENNSAIATRADVATMIYNSLEISFMTEKLTSNPDKTYMIDDRTLLHCLGITKVADKVTSVYGSSADKSDIELKENEIVISGIKYQTSLPVDASYIGLDSYIYIKNYGEYDATVLLVLPRNRNQMLEIDADDIGEDTNFEHFDYWVNEKLRTVKIDASPMVVYNGGALTTTAQLVPERLKPQCGTVLLIDSDNDNDYETIFVKDYITYIISGIRKNAIYDMYGNNISFDENTVQMSVVKNDKHISFSDLKVNDIIVLAASLDATKIEIIVSEDTAEGKVHTSFEENGYDYYTLDTNPQKAYKLTTAYSAAINAGYSVAVDFESGDRVKFYLNAFGEIARTELTEDTDLYLYGYLYDAAHKELSDKGCEMKILTKNNMFEILETPKDKKVFFGKSTYSGYTTNRIDSGELASEIGTGESTNRQLVKYKLNEGGFVTELYLLDKNADTENFSIEFGKKNFNFAYHIIDGKYYYDENTIVLHIPSSGMYPERMSAGHPSDYFSNNSSYSVELYDVDNNGYVGLIVYSAAVPRYNQVYINYTNSPVMLVTRLYAAQIDDEVKNIVEGYENGKLVTRVLSDNVSPSMKNLSVGMVIQYAMTSELSSYAMTSDETVSIILYNVLMDCNNPYQEAFDYWNYGTIEAENAKIKVSYCNVTRMDFPYIRTDGYENALYEISGTTECYRYKNDAKKTFEPIDHTEIQQGDKVFIRTRYNNLKEIIVIE